jgi:non-specific serine/threonine protein kinase/serine/threonine-protein kinase
MSQDLSHEEAVFQAALELPEGEERAAYLESACGGDAQLRRRVEALLRHCAESLGPLDRPPARLPPTTELLVERPGTTIGPYTLLEPIGEGGMGLVFVAEHQHPVRRKVALKVIKPGMDSKQVIARFEAERQALALMDHPNIAQVHDGGTTPSGRPFFVMELVQGVPLTKYCDEHCLTPKQRLELFIPICQAIQHAHQKGIIHRDIKPSNVLVALYDSRPVPKVIDFGIAKAAGQPLTEHTLVTGFGAVVGTLEYMSPEQAELNQLDIDTRSDIYSLGVLLYELLTGSTPLEKKQLQQAAMLEVLRLIREEEPPRPSTRLSMTDELAAVAARRGVEPKKLSGVVRGELDWIVMKALEKDRNRRYETASAFAADVERYLHLEPVQACPPSASYRLRKFVRRNRGTVLAAAMVVLALLAGVAVSTWQALRATQAEARAHKSAATALAINHFLIADLFDAATPETAQGRKVTVEEVLDKAAAKIDSAFPDQPEVEAGVRLAIGMAYRQLSLYPKAEPQLRRALEVRLGTLGAAHEDTLDAMNQLGQLCAYQGRYDEGERLYRQALDGMQRLRGKEDRTTLELMFNLAWLLDQHEEVAASEALYRECLEMRLRVLGENDPDTLATMAQLAENITVNGQDRWREAEPLIRRCLELRRRVSGDDHPDTLIAQHMLAKVLLAKGEWVGAERLFRESLEAHTRIQKLTHRETLQALHNLGTMHLLLGRFTEAEKELRQCREVQDQVLGPTTRESLSAAGAHGLALLACGKLEEAERLAQDNLAAIRRVLGPDTPPAYAALGRLGMVLCARGRWAEAEECSHQAADGFRRRMGPESSNSLRVLNEQAAALLGLGRRDEARALLWQVLDIRRRALPPLHPELAVSLFSCGDYLLQCGQFQQSMPLLEEALRAQRQALPPEHPATGQTLVALGWARTLGGDAAEGERPLRDGLAIVRQALPKNHWFLGDAEARLGGCLTMLGRFDEAETLLLRGHEKLEAAPGTPPGHRTQAVERLVQLYQAWGKPERSAYWRQRLATEK